MKILEKMYDTGKKIIAGATLLGMVGCGAANLNQRTIEPWQSGAQQVNEQYVSVACSEGGNFSENYESARGKAFRQLVSLFDEKKLHSRKPGPVFLYRTKIDNDEEVCVEISVDKDDVFMDEE